MGVLNCALRTLYSRFIPAWDKKRCLFLSPYPPRASVCTADHHRVLDLSAGLPNNCAVRAFKFRDCAIRAANLGWHLDV